MVDNLTISDAELWQKTIAGDIAAFEQVVERHQGAVSGVAYAILGDFALCQDVAQETFWQAWRSRNDLRDQNRLAFWLCGIARNLAHQTLKKKMNASSDEELEHLKETSHDYDPVLQSISREESSLVWNALEEIPEIYREALILFYRQGESIDDVAAALDVSTDTAKQRLSRGRDKMRSQLAMTVEGVLQRTRPSRAFTQNVMAGIVALSASFKVIASTSAAAGTAVTSKVVGTAITSAAAKGGSASLAAGVTSGVGLGILGAVVGSAAGILGAFLGVFLPAQLAGTMTERKAMEKNGKKIVIATILFTVLTFVLSVNTPSRSSGWFVPQLIFSLASTALYVLYIGINAVWTVFLIKEIRKHHTPESDPNDSRLRAYALKRIPKQRMIGRKYTSSQKLFGIPLIDIQFADQDFAEAFANGSVPDKPELRPRTAYGWIAIGDRAVGLLLAVGGVARGFIAIGGFSIGVLAFGGGACGVIAFGGGAFGLLLGIGGLAIGYDAIGGGAIGWHSATGGGAIAYHAASGGGAVAHDFAVGGGAYAAEANTPLAKEIIAKESYANYMEIYRKNQVLYILIVIALAAIPACLSPLAYTREKAKPEVQ